MLAWWVRVSSVTIGNLSEVLLCLILRQENTYHVIFKTFMRLLLLQVYLDYRDCLKICGCQCAHFYIT